MNRTRFAAIAVISVLTAGLVASCGDSSNGDPAADGDVTLTLWARGDSMPDDLEAMLAEEFPDYTIEFENIPDIEAKMHAALRADSGLPDVVVFGAGTRQFFSVQDRFLDLTEQAAEGDSVPWALEEGLTPEGRQIAMPTDIGPFAFFYRADILDSLGYPSEPDEVTAAIDSWEAYEQLARDAAATGVYVCDNAGRVHETRMNQAGYAYFALENGEEVNIVDDPISYESFIDSARLAQDGLCANVKAYTPEFNAALTQETLVGFVGPAWQDGLVRSAGENQAGNWRIAGLPGGPAASGGSFVAALANTEHPDAATELAGYIAGSEFQAASYIDKGLFPGSMGVAEDPEAAAPQEFYGGQDTLGTLMEIAKDAPYTFRGADSSAMRDRFSEALAALTTNGKDPDEAYATLVEQSDDL
jgi:cellobiose transport system substrate-binding protein